jgi:hypothetical protein
MQFLRTMGLFLCVVISLAMLAPQNAFAQG